MGTKSSLPKKRPGRPKKAQEEKLEQFSIRLTPKLKLGLELLSRTQGRSLSQAVEWALQVGLNNYRVNNEGESVADVLNRAWDKNDPFDRVFEIYNANPNMVAFDDRAGCEVVERSHEWAQAHESGTTNRLNEAAPEGDRYNLNQSIIEQRRVIFYDFVRAYWPAIRNIAVEHFSAGKPFDGRSLLNLLELRKVFMGFDDFAIMRALTEVVAGNFSGADILKRVSELDGSFIWSRNYTEPA